MNDILVPICDERDATWAATQAIALYRSAPAPVHLLNVQRALPKHVAQFVDRGELSEFHDEAGMRVLAPAKRLLDVAGVPHEDHVLVGHPAETIVRFAKEHGCRQVVVDAPAEGVLAKLGLGSVGSQVLHLMRAHSRSAATRSGVSSAR